MTAENLVRSGKISQYEYDIYIMYEGSDLGRRMLKEHLMSAVMEDPLDNPKAARAQVFAWQDGRRSVWRDINLIIIKINMLMEKEQHDRRDPESSYQL